MKNRTLLQPNSKDPELGYHPCVNLHQEKLFELPLNYEKLKSVSCTSNLWRQTYDIKKKMIPDVDVESSRPPAKSES